MSDLPALSEKTETLPEKAIDLSKIDYLPANTFFQGKLQSENQLLPAEEICFREDEMNTLSRSRILFCLLFLALMIVLAWIPW